MRWSLALMVLMMVVVVIVIVVVASEPPRLCKPGEWSDNAATRFTVLYHPFVFSPLYSRSLARALAPFHTICNFPASLVPPPLPAPPLSCGNDDGGPLSTFRSASLFISCTPLHSQQVLYLEANPRKVIIVVKRANRNVRNSRNDTSSQRIPAVFRVDSCTCSY